MEYTFVGNGFAYLSHIFPVTERVSRDKIDFILIQKIGKNPVFFQKGKTQGWTEQKIKI